MSLIALFRPHRLSRLAPRLGLLPALGLVAGCHMDVMNPAGDVAVQQRDLIVIATALILLIIVPVIVLTLAFAWKYRQSNTQAEYDPDWHHSTQLEIVIWAAPLVIIIILGSITWMSTHLLDPYRPLTRLSPSRPVSAQVQPLRVEVVAMDWKWLFVYPDLGVATVNELAAPIDTPIEFKITASSVMNSFYIPALAGQIYAMPGMQTQLHAVINKPGDYQGLSANYSGAGFSDMRFVFHGLSKPAFDQWIAQVKAGGGQMDRATYLALEKPSIKEPARRYAAVAPNLFGAVLNRCVDPAKMCAADMMRIDAHGGLGEAGIHNVLPLDYDKHQRRGGDTAEAGPAPKKTFVAALCAFVQGPNAAQSTSSPARAPGVLK